MSVFMSPMSIRAAGRLALGDYQSAWAVVRTLVGNDNGTAQRMYYPVAREMDNGKPEDYYDNCETLLCFIMWADYNTQRAIVKHFLYGEQQ